MAKFMAKHLMAGALVGVLAFGCGSKAEKARRESKQQEVQQVLRRELLNFKSKTELCRISTSAVLLTLKDDRGVVLQSSAPLQHSPFDARVELRGNKTLFLSLPGPVSPDAQEGTLSLDTWDGHTAYSSGDLEVKIPPCKKDRTEKYDSILPPIEVHNRSGDDGSLLIGAALILM